MKQYILVVGSRSIKGYNYIASELDKYCTEDTVIVSGGAKGVDSLAELYADVHHLDKFIMKANWDRYGKLAGYIRNEAMHKFIAQFSNSLCIAFWDGESKGTTHNFELAKKYNNKLIIIRKEDNQE